MRIPRSAFALAGAILLTPAMSFAQVGPFDMSGERPKQAIPPARSTPSVTRPTQSTNQPPTQQSQQAPASQPTTQAPSNQVPADPTATQAPARKAPSGEATRQSPATAPPATINAETPAHAGEKPAVAATSAEFRRFLLPAADLNLSGETDKRSWTIYLTPEQAAAPAKLNIGYQNAVVVAPENSKLSVSINNRPVSASPIRSTDKVSEFSVDVPPGLLQAGSNLVSIAADQRHRTDCSIESTYELWTNIDPARTYLSFGGPNASKLSSTDGVRAVGLDEKAQTRFNFVVPALSQPDTTRPLLRLAQALSILSAMPNQSFSFQTAGLPALVPGQMTVLVGTFAELQPVLPSLPPAAQLAPISTFITDPHSGVPMLLISGPSWQALTPAIEGFVAATDRSLDIRRDLLVTERWQSPDAPLLYGDTRLPFSQLGLVTEQFSGRRFRTGFGVAIPSDFYANAYGEATILLDAAYAASVLPGSHIDVYVNGSIASTVPITNSGGGIFRHLPIRVTLRHFKPGLNQIAVEAVLLTDEDKVCAPGATASTDPRFALFDTSEFHMPDFARIGQRPNLAALAGTGYPYSRAPSSLPIFIDRIDPDTISATATFLGRLAAISGRPLPIDVATSAATIGNRDAIFIGSISQIPAVALTQLNIATSIQTMWQPNATGQSNETSTRDTFEQWRARVRGGSWTGQISAFEEWMRRNFDISLSSLRFAPSPSPTFTPRNDETLMVAQGTSSDGGGSWTVVTAPSAADLRQGVSALSDEQNWPKIAGRITTYSASTKKIQSVAMTRYDFVPTVAASLGNYRLIIANWLSMNILSYALVFVGSAIVLGLATGGLLSAFGRGK